LSLQAFLNRLRFKTMLQKGNPVQVPKMIRWRCRIDSEKVPKVNVTAVSVYSVRESFYGQMGKDG